MPTLDASDVRSITADPTVVTSFPLERPVVRSRRRGAATGSGALPYFIAGEENRLVTFIAQADAAIFEFGNPILLIGPSGAGKTAIAMHLAAKQAAQQEDRDSSNLGPATVLYYTAVDFARKYAEAVASDDMPPLRQEINDAAILVVDDLHLIADKPAAQDELGLRIESRIDRGRPTLVTCRRLPSEIRGLRPLVVSRVLPGLTVPISTPVGDARRQLLQELALHVGLEIDPKLLDVLHTDLDARLPARSLEAALKQVLLWCRMHDAPPTTQAVESAIETVGKTEEVSLPTIAGVVAKYFRFKLSDLRSSSRKQSLVRARSLAMLLARRLTSKSMHQIGDYFGGRDHTTVLHAIRKTESLLDNDADLRRAADEVDQKLSSG